jgi:O-antigen ligase
METIVWLSNYFFALTVPFTHIGGYLGAGVGLLCVGACWKRLRYEKLLVWLLLFIGYGLLRSLFSAQPAIGYGAMFGYAAHWLWPFVLGYGLVDGRSFRRVSSVYVATVIFILVFSLLAYFGMFPPRFGSGFFLVEDGLLKGLRSHISLASICLMLSLMAAGHVIISGEMRAARRAGMITLVFFFLGALFLTGSRGYYIAAAVTFTALGVYWVVHTRKAKLFVAGAAGMAILVTVLLLLSPDLRRRITNTGPRDNNVVERVTLYRVACWEIEARPLIGFGPGQGIKQTAFFDRLPGPQRAVQRHPHLHSFYLNLAADFGFIGVVLFMLITFRALQGLWAAARAGDPFVRAMAFGLFWGFIGVLIGDSFDTLLRGPGTAMELFWLTGLVLGQANIDEESRREIYL